MSAGIEMSLDVTLTKLEPTEVFESNITHNLGDMATAAGVYNYLWRPDTVGVTRAKQLIKPLEAGLARLQAYPDKYRKYDSPNGWGEYEDLVWFVEQYLDACKAHPDAEVSVSR